MRRIILLVALSASLIWGMRTSSLAGVDLSLGGMIWYMSWEPAWRGGVYRNAGYNLNTGQYSIKEFDMKDINRLGIPMYGGTCSLTLFNRVTISGTGMYGSVTKKINCTSNTLTYIPSPGIGLGGYHTYKRDIKKWDVDTVISVSVLDFMSIITGCKVQGYRYREYHTNFPLDIPFAIKQERDKNNISYGPGLGLGFNIHLYDALYLQVSASGIVMWGFEESPSSYTWIYRYTINRLNTAFLLPMKGDYLSYGGTSSLGFAYQVPTTGLTLTLGFRYQVLRYRQTLHRRAKDLRMILMNRVYDIFDGKYDHFYGLFFATIYRFSFGSKQG